MDNGPDFTVKTPAINPSAIADILQRKREIENQQNQQALNNYNDRMKRITDAITAGQQVASNAMTLAEKRNEMAGTKELTGLLQQPAPQPPAPVANSTAGADQGNPLGSVPVMPSPEQTADYQSKIAARKQNLMAALVKANPKEVTNEFAKTQFGKPAVPDFSTKTILHDGVPTEAAFDPRSATFLDPQTKQPLTGKIEPYNALNTPTDVTDADRKRLTPLAQAVVEGRALPQALVNARGSDKVKLSQIAAEIDPQFDLSLAPQRIAIRKAFSADGKSGQVLESGNKVLAHIDVLKNKIDALDNSTIPKFNTVANWVKKNIGTPEVNGFLAAQNAVDNELGRTFQGVGVVSDTERKSFKEAINSASSPAQAKEVLSTYLDLIKGRMDATAANWTETMGDLKSPSPFFNSKTKAILTKWGYDPNTMEKREVATPAQPKSRPPLDSFFKQ